MSTQVYVDTNILIDYITGRDSRGKRFMLETMQCKYTLVVSYHTLMELDRHHENGSDFVAGFQMLQKIIQVDATTQDREVAKLLKTHSADALHAAIAMRLQIPLLTNNVSDFIGTGVRILTYSDVI